MDSSMLSPREEQQLAISLKSRRIREIALTVCSIRPLALEVKSILDDLLPSGPFPSSAQPRVQNFSGFQMPPDVNVLPRSAGPPILGRRKRQYRCNVCFVSFRSHVALIQHKSLVHRRTATTPSQGPVISLESVSSPRNTSSEKRFEQEASSTVPQTVTSTRNTSTPKTNNSDSEPQHILTSDENDSRSINRARTPSSPRVTQSVSSAEPPQHPPSEPTIKMEVIPISTSSHPVWPMSEGNMSDDSLRSTETPSTPARQAIAASPPVVSPANSLPTLPTLTTASMQPSDSATGEQTVDGLFGCPDCDFITTTRSGMQQHVSFVHGQRKPYACNQCHYSTDKRWLLTRHYLVHTGEKPHKCEVCDFGSIDHISLVKHMELKHADIKPHTCTICGTHTYTKTLLKRHMKEKHSDVTYALNSDRAANRMSQMNKNPNPAPVQSQPTESVSSVAWGAPLFPPR